MYEHISLPVNIPRVKYVPKQFPADNPIPGTSHRINHNPQHDPKRTVILPLKKGHDLRLFLNSKRVTLGLWDTKHAFGNVLALVRKVLGF